MWCVIKWKTLHGDLRCQSRSALWGNRLVSVSGAATASFSYDADGKQVKAVVDGVTTYYIGNHYEVKNNIVTKYYFAGATRLAVRTGGTLSFLLGNHPSTSLRASLGRRWVEPCVEFVETLSRPRPPPRTRAARQPEVAIRDAKLDSRTQTC